LRCPHQENDLLEKNGNQRRNRFGCGELMLGRKVPVMRNHRPMCGRNPDRLKIQAFFTTAKFVDGIVATMLPSILG